MTVLVSVIICGRDGAGFLPKLLGALQRQTLPRDRFEVVYIDDGSADGSADLVEASGRARVLRAEPAVGLPTARNLGIRAARGDVLAFTDVDTVPADDWLAAGCRRFDEAGVEYLAGGISIPVGPKPSVAALVDATTFLDQELYVTAGFAAGANFWVRRSAAERVGGFNEQLEHYGGEDEEFGWKLTTSGVRLEYAPEVRLTHPPRVHLRDLIRKAYRLGDAQAARRRVRTGSLSGTRPMFRQSWQYRPPRRMRRMSRILELDYEPTVLELVQMHIVRYFCVQLATVAGDYAGERRRRRQSRLELAPQQ